MRKLLAGLLALCLTTGGALAATTTHRVGTADTGNSPNTTGTFTPAVGDLLVVCFVGSATTTVTATCTDSTGSPTFTQVASAAYATGVNMTYCLVANSLVSAATLRSITCDTPGDTSSGTVIFVESVAGMSKTGTAAVRQSATDPEQAASTTPNPAFGASALTGNVTIGFVGNNTSPAGMTAPTSWTEPATTGDLGYSTPTTGGEIVFRDSGFTGTTITWGSASASVNGSIILELDASAITCVVGLNLLLLGVGGCP